MNKNLTEIAYILDRSGSMHGMVEPAIAGFNRFLREQQDAPGKARLTLVLFDGTTLHGKDIDKWVKDNPALVEGKKKK